MDECLAWRVGIDPPMVAPRNMALDHALAETCPAGAGRLRFYSWDAPTVSFGRNEPCRDRYDARLAAAARVALVRRPTGGRAVLHHREVTYAVAVPDRALGGPREAYRRINEGLVAGLRALGVPAGLQGPARSLPPDAGPCFAAPATGEVVVDGRKLVGSAQVRIGATLLQHGSVILDGDPADLASITAPGVVPHEPAPRSAVLADYLNALPSTEELARALLEGCRLAWGGTWTEAPWAPREREAADRWQAERYAHDDWTWRR